MASDSPSSKVYSADPALYVYTSLTAGSSHIVTATSRLETILRANKVPFKAIDIATDEKARMLWGRRAGKDEAGRLRKLPGLVQMGLVLGDLPEIEDWNEYGELKEHVTIYYDEQTQPPISQAPKMTAKPTAAPAAAKETGVAPAPAAAAAPPPAPPPPPSTSSTTADKKENQPPPGQAGSVAGSAAAALAQATLPIRSIAEEAAQKARQVHLQALRDKVYGKDGDKQKEADKTDAGESSGPTAKEGEGATSPPPETKAAETTTLPLGGAGISGTAPAMSTISLVSGDDEDGDKGGSRSVSLSLAPSMSAAGLQSPTSGAWKGATTGTTSTDALVPRTLLQSPTSGTWRPAEDGGPTVMSYHGSVVVSASLEEIAAVERAEAIAEEPEEEEEDEEEDDEAASKAGKERAGTVEGAVEGEREGDGEGEGEVEEDK